MPLFTLEERTYLDVKGKATTDESKAATLLGIEGDEILAEQAYSAGLLKDKPKAEEAPEPKMLFYDANGKQVKEGDPAAASQYLENDPNRPDSPERKAHAEAQAAAVSGEAPEEFDLEATNYGDLKKAHLVAIAESRGVEPDGGQNREHYIAALEAADA